MTISMYLPLQTLEDVVLSHSDIIQTPLHFKNLQEQIDHNQVDTLVYFHYDQSISQKHLIHSCTYLYRHEKTPKIVHLLGNHRRRIKGIIRQKRNNMFSHPSIDSTTSSCCPVFNELTPACNEATPLHQNILTTKTVDEKSNQSIY